MQETAEAAGHTWTWFAGQGVLGVWAFLATAAAVWLFKDRDQIIAREVAAAKTDSEVNKASGARLEALVQQQGQIIEGQRLQSQAILEAFTKGRRPGRRPTVTGHD